MSEDMRQKTRELEYEEKRIRSAESALVTIRLGYHKTEGVVGNVPAQNPPKRSWFKLGHRRDTEFEVEYTLTPAEVDEVYLALRKVKSDHIARATALANELGTQVKF